MYTYVHVRSNQINLFDNLTYIDIFMGIATGNAGYHVHFIFRIILDRKQLRAIEKYVIYSEYALI